MQVEMTTLNKEEKVAETLELGKNYAGSWVGVLNMVVSPQV